MPKTQKRQKETKPPAMVAQEPVFSSAQAQRVAKLGERREARLPCKVEKGKDGSYQFIEDDARKATVMAMLATGTTDQAAASRLLAQVVNAQPGMENLTNANAAIALLQGIEPQDELEGMLACQLVAVHNLSMEYARRAMGKDLSLDVSNSLINRTAKLMNIFSRQVEALNKYRNRGQQKITVQHVQVGHGGQAIIGDINQGGGQG